MVERTIVLPTRDKGVLIMATLVDKIEARAAQIIVVINTTSDHAKANRLVLAYFRLIRRAEKLHAQRLLDAVKGY